MPFCGLSYRDVDYNLLNENGSPWREPWLYFDDVSFDIKIRIESYVKAPKRSKEICVLAKLERESDNPIEAAFCFVV